MRERGVSPSEVGWTQIRGGPARMSRFSIAELLVGGSSKDEEEDPGF